VGQNHRTANTGWSAPAAAGLTSAFIESVNIGREQFVPRHFHVEGFVNQYAQDRAASSDKTLVLSPKA
jgi:hypothetical protein